MRDPDMLRKMTLKEYGLSDESVTFSATNLAAGSAPILRYRASHAATKAADMVSMISGSKA